MGFPIILENIVFEKREIQKSWMIFKEHLLQAQLSREFCLNMDIKRKHKKARSRNK